MFDCGEGTQHQLLQRSCSVSRGKIERIFLTHLHGDHCYGLPGLLCSISLVWNAPGVVPNATIQPRGASKQQPKQQDGGSSSVKPLSQVDEEDENDADAAKVHDHFSKKSQFFEIVGPEGTAVFLRSVLLASEAQFGFQYRVTELQRPNVPAATHPSSVLQEKLRAACASLRHPDEAEPRLIAPTALLLDEDEDCAPTAAASAVSPTTVPSPAVYHNFLSDDVPEAATAAAASTRLQVRAVQLDHRVFTVGYVLTEPTQPGSLDMAKVLALGVPKGPLLGQLKNGLSIQFVKQAKKASDTPTDAAASLKDEVVVVSPQDVLGPALPGRTLVLLGDTCDSRGIQRLVRSEQLPSVDWVTHECTFDHSTEHLAVPRGHSTAKMAGTFANSLGPAKQLILTHFSARFPSREKDAGPMDQLIGEAQAMCPQTNVITAEDFMNVDLERKKK